MRAKSPPRTRRQDRVDAILQVAQDLFFEQGFEAVSPDAVARRANASKATIYAHFGNKQGLLEAIVGGYLTQIQQPLQVVDRPVKEVLTRFGTSFLTLMLAPAFLSFYRLLVSKGPEMPELTKLWYAQGPRRMIAGLAAFLDSRTAELDIPDTDSAAEFFLMSLRGTLQLQAVTGLSQPPYDASIAKKVKAAVDMFLRAYARKPTASRRRRSP
jgi:AcrR family transcriptional regulator